MPYVPFKSANIACYAVSYVFRFNAAFIRDETVPDGTHMQPGTRFTKKWLVKNIGVRKWTIDTRLVMIEGLMNALVVTVPAPQLEPGEFGTISVDMVAPVEPGMYSPVCLYLLIC